MCFQVDVVFKLCFQVNYYYFSLGQDDIWIRLVYNTTDETWNDPDNKEILTEDNFDRYDSINTCTGALYAMMDLDDQWWSKCESNKAVSPYVVCELT